MLEDKRYFKTNDGIDIFYLKNFNKIDKKKPLLVFNYGLVCNVRHWEKQIPYFNDLGCQILLYDYRFHFNSSSSNDITECTFFNIAHDLKQLLDFLQSEINVLIGHSMGVNICLEFAHHFPQKTKGLVLISGSTIPPHNVMFYSQMVLEIIPKLKSFHLKFPNLFEAIWKTGHLNPLTKYLVHKIGFNKNVSEMFIEVYLEKIGELSPELFFHLMDQMKDHDINKHLGNMMFPALIIGGNKDVVIPNYVQNILHKNMPNSQLYILDQGYHVPQVDCPKLVNERIKIFLEQLS